MEPKGIVATLVPHPILESVADLRDWGCNGTGTTNPLITIPRGDGRTYSARPLPNPLVRVYAHLVYVGPPGKAVHVRVILSGERVAEWTPKGPFDTVLLEHGGGALTVIPGDSLGILIENVSDGPVEFYLMVGGAEGRPEGV